MITRLHFYNSIGSHTSVTYSYNGDMILVGGYCSPNLLDAIRIEMSLVGINKLTTLFIPDYADEFCGSYKNFDTILKELNPTYVILPEPESNPRKALQFQSCLKDYQKTNLFVVSRDYKTSVRFLLGSERGFLLLYPTSLKGNKVLKILRVGVRGLMKRALVIHPENIASCRNDNIFLNADALINLTPVDDQLSVKASTISSYIKSHLLIKYSATNVNGGLSKFWNIIAGIKHKVTKYIKNNDIILMKEDTNKISIYELNQSTGLIENRNTLTPN